MAGLFWNPRGIGEDIKKNFIRDAISEYKLYFICIQETKKSSFSAVDFDKLSGRGVFSWVIVPSVGIGGGMLLGVNNLFLDIVESEVGVFFIKVVVQDKKSGVRWNLVNIYGAPHNRDKENFLVELVHIFQNRNGLPLVVGGDFNLIRSMDECNKVLALNKWSRLFNAIIENWEIKELEMPGRRYTWSNNHVEPTLKKLDRVLFFIILGAIIPFCFPQSSSQGDVGSCTSYC